SSDSRRLTLLKNDWTVEQWDPRTGDRSLILGGRTKSSSSSWAAWPQVPYSSVLGRNGQKMAASNGEAIRIWDLKTGNETHSRFQHKTPLGDYDVLAWSPDGKWLACAVTRGDVNIWNTFTRQVSRVYAPAKRQFGPPRFLPICLVWSPDCQKLAFEGEDY